MNEKHILIVSTVASTIRGFLYPHIEFFQKKGYQVLIATNFNGNEDIKSELLHKNCKVYDVCFSRNPLKFSKLVKSLKQLKSIKRKEQIEILYTHTPIASFLSRYVFRKTNTEVIYFAHGLHFFKGADLKNWILFYPLEKLALRWTDLAITINKEDYLSLSKMKKNAKVSLFPGVGLDKEFIKRTSKINVFSRYKLYKNTGLDSFLEIDDFVILSIGELNDNKNQISVIKAVEKLVTDGAKNVKYLIVGKGSNKDKLKKYILTHKLNNNVRLLGYRNDVAYLLQLSDILISMSYREGLPVNVMEAMAMGKPALVTDIRGHRDLIQNEAMRIPISEIDTSLSLKIQNLMDNRKKMWKEGIQNKKNSEKYYVEHVLLKLEDFLNENNENI